jgi:hypothetical protein
MPLTASQLLEQRMTRDKQTIETSFQNEVALVNRRFGPVSKNPNIETARIRALSNLRRQYETKASKLLAGYEEQTRSWQEIDALAEAGQLGVTNPEELKMRTVMTPEVEKAAFPKTEAEIDPVAEYGKLSEQHSRTQSALKRFETEAPSVHESSVFSRPWFFGGGGGALKTKGGGTLVVEEKYDEPSGKMVKTRRNASREELEEWASLTEHERQLRTAMMRIRKSDAMAARLRLAAARSPRMGAAGSFADKAVGGETQSQSEQPVDFSTMSEEELKRLAGVK